jgi:CheY-like chemotaxis protein
VRDRAAAPTENNLVPLAIASQSDLKPLRVLGAEDNPVNQKMARRAIHRLRHQIRVAGNGMRAVAACAAEEFDLIPMDLQMPDMDGFEATASIREAQPSGRHTPIVAMTAHAKLGDHEQCLRAGVEGYNSKPVDLQAPGRLIDRYRNERDRAVNRLP